MLELNEVLVPVDLSAASRRTFASAQTLVTGEHPVIILLYVLDPSLVNAAAAAGLGSAALVSENARSKAHMAAGASWTNGSSWSSEYSILVG